MVAQQVIPSGYHIVQIRRFDGGVPVKRKTTHVLFELLAFAGLFRFSSEVFSHPCYSVKCANKSLHLLTVHVDDRSVVGKGLTALGNRRLVSGSRGLLVLSI